MDMALSTRLLLLIHKTYNKNIKQFLKNLID